MINRWRFTTENLTKWKAAVRDRFGDESKAATGREVRYACVRHCAGVLFVCDLLAGAGGIDVEPFAAAGGFSHPAALREEQLRDIKSKLPKNHVLTHQNPQNTIW